MEEDIKKIEEIINWLKDSSYPYDISLTRDDIQSLENLITGYRELEEYIKRLDKLNARDFVFKSDIKEKIEELSKKEKEELKSLKGQDRYFIKQMYMYKRNVLQELMEE